MTSKVVRTWQQVLDQLSSMGTTRGLDASSCRDSNDLQARLLQLHSRKDLPKATWKTLIHDMQLPRQLGLLGCSLLAEDPYKSGPILPRAFALAMESLIKIFKQAGIREGGQLDALSAPAQQQMFDSGLIKCLQQLMEATAEQLERCTAAAAAAAAPTVDGQGCLAAAAAVAGAHLAGPSALSSITNATCLELLQDAASKLLHVYVELQCVLSDALSVNSSYRKLGGTTATALHLMVAGMRHISVMMLSQQQQQQQQQQPRAALCNLAHGVAHTTLQVASCACGMDSGEELQELLGRGPHFVVWSDLALLLMTYCYILKQQQQLPIIEGLAGLISYSGRVPAVQSSGSAAHATYTTTSSSSSSSSSGRSRQQQQRRHGRSQHVLTPWSAQDSSTSDGSMRAVWQEAQRQWDRVPASHKALLQLLGVSSEAAVWLATIMAHNDTLCFPLVLYWQWNPHNLASASHSVGPRTVPPAFVQELEQQLQQWDNTPYRTLLQLLLLYGAEHAAGVSDEFIFYCWHVFRPTERLLHQQLDAARSLAQQHLAPAADSNCIPAMSPTVQDELLLLTLPLLQLLQRLREARSTSSTTPAAAPRSAQLAHSFASEAERASYLNKTEADGIMVLMLLVDFVCLGQPTLHSAEVAGRGPCYSASDVFTQQAGAIFAACESHLRAQGRAQQPSVVCTALRVAGVCCLNSGSQPGLLLRPPSSQQGRIAQWQVAFLNLLLTLLKLSVVLPSNVNTAAPPGGQWRYAVALGALYLLEVSLDGSQTAAATAAAAADASGTNSNSQSSSNSTEKGVSSNVTSPPLWLLLVGRCFLQWAAELGQLQAAGADWAQLITQARQQRGQQDVGLVMPEICSTLAVCFVNEQPMLLWFASAATNLLRLWDGSRIRAGLAATGYDMDAVLQAFEALAACYPGVLMAEGPGSAVADRVAGFIAALEAVGKACSVFAVPHCCNNPGCSNLAGASELVLVSGKGCICGGCKVARYCGKACQRAHWKQHKPICKMLSAAAPA